jgi:hypothetical protein
MLRKQKAIFLVLVSLLGAFALAACDGMAVIDVNVDPETGQGNIVVNSDDDGGEVDVNVDDNSNADMSQILLFGIVVALLLGTVAIVVSTSRRDRG